MNYAAIDENIEVEAARRFARELLARYGADPDEASIAADAMIWCDSRGLPSQGLCRIPIFVKRLAAGGIVSPCHAEFRQLGATIEILNGHGGFGQVVAVKAVHRSVELARDHGLAAVAAINSNHFGAAGYFAHLAAQRGLVALVMSNAYPTVAAPGGHRAVLGTNPLAVAAPGRNGESLNIDMGTTFGSVTATVTRAREAGRVENGIAVDRQGRALKDATKLREGALLPMAPKDFALGLAIEVLSGVLTGAGFSQQLHSFYREVDHPGGLGHLFICLDVRRFMPLEQFLLRLDHLIELIKAPDNSDPDQPIRLPGEKRWVIHRQNVASGTIPLSRQTISVLGDLAGNVGLHPLGCR